MNFEHTEEQQMLQDILRRVLREQVDSENLWSQLSELGIFAALFSEDDGGLGGTGFDIAVVFEELGRAGSVLPIIDSALICGRLLSQCGSQKDLLQRVINGDVQLAFAHGEPQARYATNWVECRAESHLINGRKSIVVNAESAEFFLVSARVSGVATDQSGIALYLAPANSDGIRLHAYDLAGGGRAAEVIFDNVQLDVDSCLTDDAYVKIETTFAAATVAQCAETLGAMETAANLTLEYLGIRKQFGRPIATFQALAHRMADIMVEIEQVRSAVILAAGYVDAESNLRDRHISAAKNLVGRAGKLIAEETIQMHGGIGMTDEYQLGKFAKRIVMADHRFGDTDYHLQRFIELTP